MALTTNKKNKIIADWKAGRFNTAYAISKEYKIDQKTAQKIIDGFSQGNADIVAIGTAYEIAKKSIKNPVEKKAIEKLVEERSIADDIEREVYAGTLDNVKSVRKKIQLEEVDNMQDHRHAQETLDKALITAGKAQRFAPKTDVNLTNAQQNNITVEIE
jgi:hypothetical protein